MSYVSHFISVVSVSNPSFNPDCAKARSRLIQTLAVMDFSRHSPQTGIAMIDFGEAMENAAEQRFEEMMQPDGFLKCCCGNSFDPEFEGGCVSPNP